MSFPEVAIIGLGLWLEGYPSAIVWRSRVRDPAATKPSGRSLDRVNRRRAGALCRALADVTAEALAQAAVDPATVPTVIGSSIGEAATMIGLLDAMLRHGTPMSPADFAVSVHNAASGLISIANKNRGMTTSIAADENTPGAALIEATGLVAAHGTPVLVACADEPAPDVLVQHAPPWAMLAAAVVLAPAQFDRPHLASLRLTAGAPATIPAPEFEPLVLQNPQIGMAWLVDAVQRGATGHLALSRLPTSSLTAELSPPLA